MNILIWAVEKKIFEKSLFYIYAFARSEIKNFLLWLLLFVCLFFLGGGQYEVGNRSRREEVFPTQMPTRNK